ncbi:MAG: arginine--tRNA ligase [Bacteroidetes bacterium MED-G13]|nr:MAG: arginine--tRNA ligase [Bacteroidetes bacterium MED-G13]
MHIQKIIRENIKTALNEIFKLKTKNIELQQTKKEFDGDITLVVFPLVKELKMNPKEIAEKLGNYLVQTNSIVSYNVVSGFLNLSISDEYYLDLFNSIKDNLEYGYSNINSEDVVMVEYSSPNTNKPLHLGHIRNNLLGYSMSEIYKASGKKVYKTQIINDRGIHICKSMIAWLDYSNGDTPESTNTKGDKFVGDYYIKFDKLYKKEVEELIKSGSNEKEAMQNAPILLRAKEMLIKWESVDKEVVELWKKMNSWVYEGFEETYKNLGVDFDSYYYESDTYLLGKEFILSGLKSSVFYKKDDGSVWCDLTNEGLDEKIVLRADGTAVYMTQDIGTAVQRVKDFPDINSMVYTVGNEQDYHFKVLFLILKKLGFSWSENLFHLSYGMVDLPSGKMKSREGTVVDADDLMEEMTRTAKDVSQKLGKLDGLSEDEKNNVFKTVGLGALKYYILKVDPKKRILFDPKESVDFQGNTASFIQYSYARIQSILNGVNFELVTNKYERQLEVKEKDLIKQIDLFPSVISGAASSHNPALVANYVYDLVKSFNSFYQSLPILKSAFDDKKSFRVELSKLVGITIKNALSMLGIGVVDRM